MFSALTTDNRFALHSVAVCLLALLGTLMNVAAIDDYVIQVLLLRWDRFRGNGKSLLMS
jgi:hypothetical protein